MIRQRKAFVRQYIKNFHESQKWMWTILMVFSLYEATTVLMNLLEEALADTASWDHFGASGILYVGFLIMIYRFFTGDNRIVDYYYDSLPEAFAKEDKQFGKYVATLQPQILFMDGVIRVLQYLFFVAAAVNIDSPRIFASIAAILLFVNALFSLFVLQKVGTIDGGDRSQVIKDLVNEIFEKEPLQKLAGELLDFEKCRRVWLANNLIFSALIALLLIFPDYFSEFLFDSAYAEIYVIGVLLCVNSLFDLWKCDHIYRPRFDNLLGESA